MATPSSSLPPPLVGRSTTLHDCPLPPLTSRHCTVSQPHPQEQVEINGGGSGDVEKKKLAKVTVLDTWTCGTRVPATSTEAATVRSTRTSSSPRETDPITHEEIVGRMIGDEDDEI
ncbi:unnamed protein product [Urochloa humidicola]